jgi:hypothetical protein
VFTNSLLATATAYPPKSRKSPLAASAHVDLRMLGVCRIKGLSPRGCEVRVGHGRICEHFREVANKKRKCIIERRLGEQSYEGAEWSSWSKQALTALLVD